MLGPVCLYGPGPCLFMVPVCLYGVCLYWCYGPVCLYGLGRQPCPGRANFSLKSLKDSTNRLYDPARVVSGGETTRLGELSRLGR